MRFLLDTNIFIYREDDKILTSNLQSMLRTLNKMNVELLIHPLSFHELKKDKNLKRQKIILSKLNTYCKLESPPDPKTNKEFYDKFKWDDTGEVVDNTILYTIYRDAVDFLITEDKGIHKKAKKLDLDNRVLLIDDAYQMFHYEYKKTKFHPPPALKKDVIYNLNLDDPIFDSLKYKYKDFNEWFKKISREGRECFVHYREDKSIGALLIYKVEDEIINSNPPLPRKKRLKICTFIVTHVGRKIGELFIKLAIDIAINKEIFEIYLTHFTEPDDKLIQLITEYGFYKKANYRNEEKVFIKELIAQEKFDKKIPLNISKKYYPSFYDGIWVNKFIIPIQPEYHNRLFTGFIGRQTKITEYEGKFIIEGNTIKKAYLTHSKILKMKRGDIILFYR